MLQFLSSDPFLLPIHELDRGAIEGWNIFQSSILKSIGYVSIYDLDAKSQSGWDLFQSGLSKSASPYKNFSINDSCIKRNTISFNELFNDRPLGVTLERQQLAVAKLMIHLDPDTALAIMFDEEM